MAAFAMPGGPPGPPPRRSPVTLGRVAMLGGVVLAALVVWSLMNAQIVSQRPSDRKTTTVILPPPPPPPPEVIPDEKPPEPTEAPPIEQPLDTPPPEAAPEPSAEPAPGDNALTAREGAGPSNYGLARGDGSGTKIGGRPGGGNGFGAYASQIMPLLSRAAQADPLLARARFSARVQIVVTAEGRIAGITILDGTGDTRRDEALRRRLAGLQLPPPPAGLPSMRIEVSSS